MNELSRCVCGGAFHDGDSFVQHTYQCADWLAFEEHLTGTAADA